MATRTTGTGSTGRCWKGRNSSTWSILRPACATNPPIAAQPRGADNVVCLWVKSNDDTRGAGACYQLDFYGIGQNTGPTGDQARQAPQEARDRLGHGPGGRNWTRRQRWHTRVTWGPPGVPADWIDGCPWQRRCDWSAGSTDLTGDSARGLRAPGHCRKRGAAGPRGARAHRGPLGVRVRPVPAEWQVGPSGATGARGATGAAGPIGSTRASWGAGGDGRDRKRGRAGSTGASGATGPAGSPYAWTHAELSGFKTVTTPQTILGTELLSAGSTLPPLLRLWWQGKRCLRGDRADGRRRQLRRGRVALPGGQCGHAGVPLRSIEFVGSPQRSTSSPGGRHCGDDRRGGQPGKRQRHRYQRPAVS